MAVSTKPTIVLVPGAWHTPEGFMPLIALLEAADYPVKALPLPSVGARPGFDTLDADVTAIRQAVTDLVEAGKEVVLLMHSYGGIPGTEASKGLGRAERKSHGKNGGVARLIYIAAFVVRAGQDLETARNSHYPNLPALQCDESTEDKTLTLKPGVAEAHLYNDLSPEEAAYHMSLLKSHSTGTLTSPLTHEAYRHIPSAYLIPTLDLAIHVQAQHHMAREAGIELVEEVEAGHNPWLKRPDIVARFVRKAAGGEVV